MEYERKMRANRYLEDKEDRVLKYLVQTLINNISTAELQRIFNFEKIDPNNMNDVLQSIKGDQTYEETAAKERTLHLMMFLKENNQVEYRVHVNL